MKDNCSGTPSTEYGFQVEDKWFLCVGDMEGEAISFNDDIMLYFLQADKYISVNSHLYLIKRISAK